MSELAPVEIESLPRSMEAFADLQQRLARSPEGGAAMMVLALLLYAEDEELGGGCLAAAADRGRLQEGSGGYAGWRLGKRDLSLIRSQVGGRPHILRSYFAGATPENGYRLPAPPFRLECSANPYSGEMAAGRYKAFVASSGAASPRPVTVQRDEQGLWKAHEWSSLLLGVQEPTAI